MLKQRIITAAILAPIVLGCVFFFPPLPFAFFVAAVVMIGAWEWANLADYSGASRYVYAIVIGVLLAGVYQLGRPVPIMAAGLAWWCLALVLILRYPAAVELWRPQWSKSLIGVLVLVPAFVALVQLKSYQDSTFLILLLFLLIWGADIGAYFSGRAFGKRKLAPRVSPGKSWAGVYGGLLSAGAVAILMAVWAGKPAPWSVDAVVFLCGCLTVVALSIVGDLSVSMFKRVRDVKDSSNLLPGHGGVLDRIDSLLSAGPAFAVFIIWYGWS